MKFATTKKIQNYTHFNQHSIDVQNLFIGCLLGDASIKRGRILNSLKLKNSIIQFSQGENHIEYIQFLKTFLQERNYTNDSVCVRKKISDITFKLQTLTSFSTFSFKSLNELHTLFYRKATEKEQQQGRRFIKIIPSNIEKLLNFQVFAYAFMDDGSYHIYHGSAVLCTHGFPKTEVEKLSLVLTKVLGLESSLQKARENQYVLYFPKTEVEKMRISIKPYLLPSMYYKLGLDLEGMPIDLKTPIVNPLSKKKPLRAVGNLSDHPDEIISPLIGLVVGGCFVEQNNKSSMIRFDFSGKNVEFGKYLHKYFNERGYCSETLNIKIRTIKGKSFENVRFSTLSYPSFNEFREIFYKEKELSTDEKKIYTPIIPLNLETLIDEQALAFFYMVSGSYKKDTKGCLFQTQGYTYEEVCIFQNMLLNNFNLSSKIHKDDKYSRLYLSRNQTEKLAVLIKDFVPSFMLPKLGL